MLGGECRSGDIPPVIFREMGHQTTSKQMQVSQCECVFQYAGLNQVFQDQKKRTKTHGQWEVVVQL